MIEYDAEGQEQARREQERRQRYRNVFGTEEGRKVLGDIMLRNHFGVPISSEAERHEYNVAVEIARTSGMLSAILVALGIEED